MNQQKKNLGALIVPGVILFIVGLFVFLVDITDLGTALHGPVDFASLQPHEITEGLYVEATLDANFGCFAEEYEENTETKEVRTTNLYYVIWTGDENTEDWRYMGIDVIVYEMDAMEAMAEETYSNGYAQTPLTYRGKIFKMSDEVYAYFEDYFLEAGFTPEEIEAGTLPYYIATGYSAGFTVFLVVISVVMMIVGVILFVVGVKHFHIKSKTEETEWTYVG